MRRLVLPRKPERRKKHRRKRKGIMTQTPQVTVTVTVTTVPFVADFISLLPDNLIFFLSARAFPVHKKDMRDWMIALLCKPREHESVPQIVALKALGGNC